MHERSTTRVRNCGHSTGEQLARLQGTRLPFYRCFSAQPYYFIAVLARSSVRTHVEASERVVLADALEQKERCDVLASCLVQSQLSDAIARCVGCWCWYQQLTHLAIASESWRCRFPLRCSLDAELARVGSRERTPKRMNA